MRRWAVLVRDPESTVPKRGGPPARLTVAHIIHSLGAGGAESVLCEFAAAAETAALRPVVIGLSDARSGTTVDRRAALRLRENGATVHEMHAGRYSPGIAVAVARLLRAEGVDVVHTHLKHADVIGGAAARLARLPSVSTLHVIDVPTSRSHLVRLKAAVFARRKLSSTVIALSSEQRNWYARCAGPDAPITLLPNGVAEPEVTRERAFIRAQLGVGGGELLALSVSLMRPEKGHTDLLEALRLVPEELSLVVAMAGDGPLLDEVRSIVGSDPKLQWRVRVLGYRSDVADLLAACDFVVQPSREDALPTALISALAAARPIVATNVGGIPDIVTPGCGILVDAGNPASLAAGMAEMGQLLRTDGPAVEAMRRDTRRHYEDRFSAHGWVQKLRIVYEEAMGVRRTPEVGDLGLEGDDDVTETIGIAADLPTAATISQSSQRIAIVQFAPSGGLFQFSLQLGEGLARGGNQVELITGPAPERGSREPGCRVNTALPTWHPTAGADAPHWWRRIRRGLRAVQYIGAWCVLFRQLLRSPPDVVIWAAWQFPVDGWGVHLVRKTLPHSVLALLAHEPRGRAGQLGGQRWVLDITARAFCRAYADLDVAFVLGESTKRALIESWPITAPVHVIPHGDSGLVSSGGEVSGADTTAPVALFFGTLTAYKGIDTLCEAWPLVRQEVPEAELMIVGALGADMARSTLTATVEALDGVVLRIGYVPLDDVSAFFARARCVVLPYKQSSQSGVAHLAHTLRRPVVATAVGDIPAVIEDGKSGLLVPPGRPDALARALVELLTDSGAAYRMGQAGADALASVGSWDVIADRVGAALISRGASQGSRP